jgi:hypothetical protein
MRAERSEAAGDWERDMSLPWFACGLITGVALTLLLTPVPGRETRRWIVQTGGATRRRTAAILERNRRAMAVVRKYGVLGLARQRARSVREAVGESPARRQATSQGAAQMVP